MATKSILIGMHLLGAVIWVGGIFFMQVIMKKITADLEGPVRQKLMGSTFGFFFQWVWVAVVTILVTGFGVIFGLYGGFGNLPFIAFKHIHIMTLTGSTMALLFFYIYFGPFQNLKKAIVAKDGPTIARNIKTIRTFGTAQLVLGILTLFLVQALQG